MSAPSADEDAMQQAGKIVQKYIKLGVKFVVGPNVYAEWMKKEIATAITAAKAQAYERAAQWVERQRPELGMGVRALSNTEAQNNE